jgi:hypothetical protein
VARIVRFVFDFKCWLPLAVVECSKKQKVNSNKNQDKQKETTKNAATSSDAGSTLALEGVSNQQIE